MQKRCNEEKSVVHKEPVVRGGEGAPVGGLLADGDEGVGGGGEGEGAEAMAFHTASPPPPRRGGGSSGWQQKLQAWGRGSRPSCSIPLSLSLF